ncbi:MAG: hypothetical protein ACREC6_08335 [Hyphomicrobiaceae bacterium]
MNSKIALIALLSGLALTLASWTIAWSRIPIISEHAFFPLWLAYILTINGIAEYVFRDSLLRRLGISFLLLFAISIPFWWFFELVNAVVRNWNYLLPYPVSSIRYAIQASIYFSTVVPAVLSTSFLFCLLLRSRVAALQGSPIAIEHRWLALSVLLGMLSQALLPVIPQVAFPLVWVAPALVMEPLLFALGYRSWLRHIEGGNRLPFVSVALATLFTGIWWELWNVYSSPKWIYTIPYVDFWKIFEMPILGYLGYPFFGLIVYSYAILVVSGVLGRDISDELSCSSR